MNYGLPSSQQRRASRCSRRRSLLSFSASFGDWPRATDSNPLSARERQVLQFVARGLRYAEIASELSISAKTVENHVRNILGKLHLTRRTDLVRYAVRHGLD